MKFENLSRLGVVLVLAAVVATILFTRNALEQRTAATSNKVPPEVYLDNPALMEGSRVMVAPSFSWAQGSTGVITQPPEVVRRYAGNWEGVKRVVQGTKAPVHYYWVQFDTPQRYEDTEQHYFAAEIPGGFLELIGDGARVPPPALPDGTVEASWYENKRLGIRVEFKAFIK